MLNQRVTTEGHEVFVTLKMLCTLQVVVAKYSTGPATHRAAASMEAFQWSALKMTKLVSLLRVCSFKGTAQYFRKIA